MEIRNGAWDAAPAGSKAKQDAGGTCFKAMCSFEKECVAAFDMNWELMVSPKEGGGVL